MQPEVILKFFAEVIERELGIVYAEHNYFQLQNRLEDIARALGHASVDHLHEIAQRGITGAFKQLLLDVATNNETSFFRDLKVFNALETLILPKIREAGGHEKKVRIWSAASSTGQEALSISMLILEQEKKMGRKFDFEVLGTDISERALNKAKLGVYTQLEIQRGLPAPLLLRYFKKDDQDRWQANTDLREKTSFKSLNLKATFNFSFPFDLVFCRNVLIYQNVQGKIDIIKKISETLSPAGFLIMGSGENLFGLSGDFAQIITDGAVIYQKKNNETKAA